MKVTCRPRHQAQSDLYRLGQGVVHLARPLLSVATPLLERRSAPVNDMASPGKEIGSSLTVEVVVVVIAIRRIVRPNLRMRGMFPVRQGDKGLS